VHDRCHFCANLSHASPAGAGLGIAGVRGWIRAEEGGPVGGRAPSAHALTDLVVGRRVLRDECHQGCDRPS